MKTGLIKSTTITKAVLIFSLLLVFACLSAFSQDYKKSYHGEYTVDKGAALVIKNKFGDINCQVWDQDRVTIDVTVNVDVSSQEKANRVFDKIDVQLSGNRTKVTGTTNIGSINNADFSVDYDIHMPSWISIDLDNKFGDITLPDIAGPATINVEYGALEARSLDGEKVDLTIKFSSAEVDRMKTGTVSVEYGSWESEDVGNLTIKSRFSEVQAEKVGLLNLDSQYDEVEFENASQVISVSRFSSLKFDEIKGDFDFDMEYGELEAKYISEAFKVGKIRNSFADANITFDPKASMTVDAEMRFGELSYPKSGASLNKTTEGYTTNIYNGKLGNASGPVSKLTINSKNCDVDIDFED